MSPFEIPDGHRLLGAEAISEPLAAVASLATADVPWALGWATVELDRAEAELRQAFAQFGAGAATEATDDDLLGARCRLVSFGGGSFQVALLEPSTEGRLAASLVRYGEGFVAAYAPLADLDRVGTSSGLLLSAEADGPFGRQRLVLGGPAWGAHLLLTAADRAAAPGAATIRS